MKVRDVMTADVLTVRRDTPVGQLAATMVERGVSALPVVGEGNRVAGVVGELELIVRQTRLSPPWEVPLLDARIPLETPSHYEKRMQHMLGTRAEDVMTEEFSTVSPDLELEDLAQLMVDDKANPVLVVEGEALVGIVTRSDLVRLMARS